MKLLKAKVYLNISEGFKMKCKREWGDLFVREGNPFFKKAV